MARITGLLALLVVSTGSTSYGAGAEAQPAVPAVPGTVSVAVYDDRGVSRSLRAFVASLSGYPDLKVSRLRAQDIRSGRLAQYDVLLHPGGSGGKQGKALGEQGREQVRSFVKRGGGYLGICAGAYLASCDYPWSLGILDARVVDKQHWARGTGDVGLRLTTAGRDLLGLGRDRETFPYYQGPLLAPAHHPQIPDYDTLATFDEEIAKNGAPEGVMKGTTAIASGRYGAGRVLCFSPHPEKTRALRAVVHRAILWAARKQRTGEQHGPSTGKDLLQE